LLVGLVLAWTVAQGALLQFEDFAPSAGLANIVFIVGAALSLLAHEAAQGLVARAVGLRDRDGGFFGSGSIRELRQQPKACTAELAMAVAGPLVAVLLSSAVIAGARAAYVAGLADPLIRALAAVATFNIVLAAANLLPILPMDGGRLLRALLWRFGGDLDRAMLIATVTSRAAGLLIIAAGLAAALVDTVGDALTWILVGVLLYADARPEPDAARPFGVTVTERLKAEVGAGGRGRARRRG
jgi:Zn-dependent protease